MIGKLLVGEMSRMVAVLSSSVANPFEMMLFRGIDEVLGAYDYHILFHNVRAEHQDDPVAMANLLAYRPAGCIVLKGAEGRGGEFARRFLQEHIPVVMQGHVPNLKIYSVCVDDRVGMRLATDYVIQMGHRRLSHLAGPEFAVSAKERKKGFVESVIEHDIALSDAVILSAGETPAGGYAGACEVLRQSRPRPTALVCFNDIVAMGAYRAAHELGLAIPDDLSVIGFGGVDVGELLGPPLTTVDAFPQEIGRRAAELLMEALDGRSGRTPRREWVEAKLVERGSVIAVGTTGAGLARGADRIAKAQPL